ncbi:MAG: ABC transporter ATP-binding protein [Deltaproteobacteria bacterium]|nr:ABC transporter ATP-binding protein [Deltaproteobacteria bacterium]
MFETVIKVENLSKRYRLGETHRGAHSFEDPGSIWALKDVSFEVRRGEVLGVIGKNGAGKSTLLKILSRITTPTAGSAWIEGRVGSLLEVGTGFHPELTGRENIYLNGAILGMKRHEIRRKFDEIVAFAEIEKFLDTPVKRYSSGMYVRLAFAVAAHLEPEILLVDEVLAVGDAAFQQKCLGRIGTSSNSGKTTLLVSHNMSAINRLCQRCLWIENGSILKHGNPAEIVRDYLSRQVIRKPVVEFPLDESKKAQITRLEILDHKGTPTDKIFIQHPFTIRIHYRLYSRVIRYRVGVKIQLNDGLDVLVSTTSDVKGDLLSNGEGTYSAELSVPGNLIAQGSYQVTCFLGQPGLRVLDRHENVSHFVIQGHNRSFHEPSRGIIAAQLDWDLTQ